MDRKKLIGFLLAAEMAASAFVPFSAVSAAELSGISGADAITVAKVGKNYAYLRGGREQIKTPYAKDGRVYMSLRDLAEITNSPIEWNSYTKKAIVYYLQYEFEVSGGSNILYKKLQFDNSVEEIKMPGTADVINGTIYIPVESYMKAVGDPYWSDGEYVTFGRTRYTDDEIVGAGVDFSGLFTDSFDENNTMKIFYVDPERGRDEGMGTSDDPFRSINGAKLYIREYKKKNPMNGNIVVYLRGGEYNESAGVVFEPEDSGENGYHIKYMAYPGEVPKVTSAKRVTDWELHDEEKNIYVATVGKGTMFQYMSENNEQSVPARWPNEGYLHAVSATEGPSKTEFFAAENDIPTMANPTDARVYMWPGGANGIYMWFSDYYGIGAFDAETGKINITSDASYVIGTGTAYYFENAYEFMDMPGEFYNSSDGKVYYIPRSGDINSAEVKYTTSTNVFKFAGTEDKSVTDIDLRGLDISTTERGFNTIDIKYGRDIIIDDCYIHESGKMGVNIENSYDVEVTNSKLENIGQNGVGIYKKGATGYENLMGYNKAENNIIVNVGSVYGDASGVQINGSDRNYVGHNTIEDSPRFGVCVNGNKNDVQNKYEYKDWGTYTTGRENVVDSNDIGYAMNESQDGGAIYGWQSGNGNVLKRNNIYGVSVQQSYGFGIYLDDGWDHCWVYDNIVANNQTEITDGALEGVFFLKGVENKVYNNIVYNNANPPKEGVAQGVFYTHPMGNVPNDKLSIRNNIVYDSGTYINHVHASANTKFSDPMETRMDMQDFNLYYYTSGEYAVDCAAGGIDTIEDWMRWQNAKYDQNSVFGENPQFVDAEGGDFRIAYNSPAKKIGYRDIDFSEIGLSGYNRYADYSKPIKNLYIENPITGENSSTRLLAGESVNLRVSGKTEDLAFIDMSKATVTFASDNTAVATVDAAGRVSAHGAGTAKLTVSASANGATVSKNYWIVVQDTLSAVAYNVPDTTYLTGSERQTNVVATTNTGRSFNPDNVKYTSSNTAVATVDEKGLVKFVGAGTAQLTATVTYEGQTISDSKTVLVRDALFDKSSVTVAKKMVKVGEKLPINIQAWDSDGNTFAGNVGVTVERQDGMSVAQNGDDVAVTFDKAGTYAVKVSCLADSVKTVQTLQLIAVEDDTIDNSWKSSAYGDGTKVNAKVTENGEFEYETSGIDLWGTADSGSIVYKEIKLDEANPKAEVIAEFHSWPGSIWEDGLTKCKAQVGVMIREKDAAGAKHVTYRWGEGDASPFTWRPTENEGYKYSGTKTVNQDHVWLRIVRDGNKFTGYMKLNAEDDWTETASCEMEMSNEVIIGITGYSTTQEKMTGAVGKVEINTGDDVTKDSAGEIYEVSEALANYAPLKDKDEITVCYIGGSLTQGGAGGVLAKDNFAGKTTAFLQQAFPDKKVNGVNAGVGGTGSNYGILRLKKDVISYNPDIVMIEFTGNDSGYNQEDVKKQAEGIVRQLNAMDEPPMIVFYYAPGNTAEKYEDCRATYNEIAARYSIPVIDGSDYIWNKYWGNYPSEEELDKFFIYDRVHYTAYGYSVQSEYIRECLNNPSKYLKYAKKDAEPLTDYYDISAKYVKANEAKKVSGWNAGSATSTAITSNTAGDTVTYTFTGNVFAIRGSLGKKFGKYSVQIDSNPAKTITAYYEPTEDSKVIMYSSFNLGAGKHTVTIKNLEGMNVIDEFLVNDK